MKPRLVEDLDTRQRLIESAGEQFAEHGFRRATVRNICRRAGANVAAVNYHFGDKQRLYLEVLDESFRAAEERFPSLAPVDAALSPEERLHAFVLAFLRRLYSGGIPAWLMKLITREMFEPTGALEHLVERVHRPMLHRLRELVQGVGGPTLVDPEALRCAQGVIAQCVFYKHAQAVIRALGHKEPSSESEVAALARQITDFSVAGIRDAARRAKRAR